MHIRFIILSLVLTSALVCPAIGQSSFRFTHVTSCPVTSVKNQARTNTCWSFATISFIEAELMRSGRDSLDLSEMFTVRMTYPEKARNYLRRQGATAFGEGSVAGDALRVVQMYGMMPESAYPGLIAGRDQHDHAELHAALKGMMDGILHGVSTNRTAVVPAAVSAVLDSYLGHVPDRFTYKGRTYTPAEFALHSGFKPEDYIELTSFTHHPFYTYMAVEVPDNWAGNRSFNVPLNVLTEVMERALENGYSVLWDGDVSEKSFCHGKGVAVLPDNLPGERTCTIPEPEAVVTQDSRQKAFESGSTTDDHLMHLTGLATDQNGERYFRTKNSWGTDNSHFAGYLYMSKPYVQAKTISIVVHRDVLPDELRDKLK